MCLLKSKLEGKGQRRRKERKEEYRIERPTFANSQAQEYISGEKHKHRV